MCFLAVWIVQAIILARAILPRGQAEGLSSFTLTLRDLIGVGGYNFQPRTSIIRSPLPQSLPRTRDGGEGEKHEYLHLPALGERGRLGGKILTNRTQVL